jgi:hypothetical protein
MKMGKHIVLFGAVIYLAFFCTLFAVEKEIGTHHKIIINNKTQDLIGVSANNGSVVFGKLTAIHSNGSDSIEFNTDIRMPVNIVVYKIGDGNIDKGDKVSGVAQNQLNQFSFNSDDNFDSPRKERINDLMSISTPGLFYDVDATIESKITGDEAPYQKDFIINILNITEKGSSPKL